MLEALISNIYGTLVFICVLSVLILVHEWGHFITAKKLGVQVERFALGFGPKLYSRKYKGTEYMLCLIPLGGYVKMAGDERSECKGSPNEFYSKPPGLRSLIIINGPVTNFILAYVCLYFVFVMGYPDMSNKVGKLMEGYPAATAGLKEGDTILEVDNIKTSSWTDVQKAVRESKEESISVKYLRGGVSYNTHIIPKIDSIENIFGQEKKSRLIGIRPTEEIVSLKYGPLVSFKMAYKKLLNITTVTYKAIYYMITGKMSAKDSVTGPIGIFYIVKSAAEMGFSHVLFILGVISASLAIFNLLPVIPLDGGHLLLLAVEKVRGKPLSDKTDEFIMRLGFSLIIVLAVFVFYTDFSRLGWIDKIKGIIH